MWRVIDRMGTVRRPLPQGLAWIAWTARVIPAPLRLPDPEIAGRRESRDWVHGVAGRIQGSEDGPVLSRLEGPVVPVQAAIRKPKAEQIHVHPVRKLRLAAEKIEFKLAAQPGAGYVRLIAAQAEPGLTRRHSKVLVSRGWVRSPLAQEQREILNIVRRGVIERIEEHRAIQDHRNMRL